MRRPSRTLLAPFLVLALVVPVAGVRSAPRVKPPGPTGPHPGPVESFLDRARAARTADEFKPRASRDHIVASFPSASTARAEARRKGWRIVDDVDGEGTVLLELPDDASPRGFARTVDRDPATEYAEPDHRIRPLASQITDWGVEAIEAPTAHGNGFTGAGVTVAVIDSGVDYLHEDLDANIWTNAGEIAGNGIDDDGNGYVDDVRGWDFIGSFYTSIQEDDDPMDVLGHGTHVAGIVGAEDNGVGVLGAAPDATLMPVRALDDVGFGWDSTIAKAIRYAVDNGADVINLSLGAYQPSSLLGSAVRYAASNGVAVVAAAGNEFFYSIPSYPAGFPEAISVAAASRADETRVWWSNWGNVDFLAPGEEVLSTTPNDAYKRFSGTSMASPHVAGALALLLEAHPGLDGEQLEQALAATADDRWIPGKDEATGSGFPDAGAATGALPASQVELYRDPYLIPSDGTEAEVTLRLLDATGSPIVGATGTFSTDVGAVSPTPFTTDADGEATTELTVHDHFGVATVTATPDAHPARDIRVIVEDDRVRVDDAMVGPPTDFFFFDEFFAAEPAGASSSPKAVPSPGNDVQVTVTLGNHRFGDPKRASVEFSVTDPTGAPVPGLSGEIEPSVVGFEDWGLWSSQARVGSLLLTIPSGARKGRYELTVTATTEHSGLEDTRVTPFWVGVRPEILIVREGFGFNAETLNYFDFFFWGMDWGLKDILDAQGHSFDVAEFFVGPQRMKQYSAVIWTGAWDWLDTWSVESYLDAGGNILLSGEQWATLDRLFPEPTFRDYLHVGGLQTSEFPDRNNQIYPTEVTGTAGSLFAGETLDIDSQDLGSSRDPTALFTDEIVLQRPGTTTTPLFTYPSGVHAPPLAGAFVDARRYRSLYLGFGIEAIDDDESTITAAGLVERVLDALAPAPVIKRVRPRRLTRAGGSFRILGKNFQRLGRTVVRVAGRRVAATVASRTVIRARLPRGFRTGRHAVTVVNPFGDSVTKARALRVTA